MCSLREKPRGPLALVHEARLPLTPDDTAICPPEQRERGLRVHETNEPGASVWC